MVVALIGPAATAAPASASDMKGWSCQVELTAQSGTIDSIGSATCQTETGATLQGTADMTLSGSPGQCTTGESSIYTGTLTITDPAGGSSGLSDVSVEAYPGRETGTITLASGPTGTIAFQEDDPTNSVIARCFTGNDAPWRQLHVAFSDEARNVSASAEGAADRVWSASQQVLPSDPEGPSPVEVGDALNDGYNTIKGIKRGVDDCAFSYSVTLKTNQRSRSFREVGFNPADCTLGVLVTTADDAPGAPDASQSSSPSSESGPTDLLPVPICADGLGADKALCGSSYRRSAGLYRVWIEDPANYPVNKVEQTLDFHYGNGCVHNPITWNVWSWWLSDTGWSMASKNDWADQSCGSTYISSYRHFHNGIFCAGFNTDTYYDRQLLMGHTNGELTGTVHTERKGACNWMLHMEAALIRTAG